MSQISGILRCDALVFACSVNQGLGEELLSCAQGDAQHDAAFDSLRVLSTEDIDVYRMWAWFLPSDYCCHDRHTAVMVDYVSTDQSLLIVPLRTGPLYETAGMSCVYTAVENITRSCSGQGLHWQVEAEIVPVVTFMYRLARHAASLVLSSTP